MKRTIVLIAALVAMFATAVAQQAQPKQGSKKSSKNEAETLFDYVKQVTSSNAAFSYAIIASPEIDAADTAGCRLSRAVDEINAMPEIAFVVVLGNITADGSSASIQAAHSILRRLNASCYALPGERDIDIQHNGGTDFRRIFGDDKFRANVNGLFFLGLNTSTTETPGLGHLLPQNSLWLKNQLKNVGKKIPVYLFTTQALADGRIDNWHDVTDQARRYNTQLLVSADRDSFGRATHDQMAGYSVERLRRSYTICRVWEDTTVLCRKQLGVAPVEEDTIAMEVKTYLEAERRATAATATADKCLWSYACPTAVYSGAAVSRACCYFGDDNGTLYCLDLGKGKLRWKYQTALRITARPTVVGDVVLFGSCDKSLYCLGAERGEFRWRLRTGRAVTSEPIISGDTLYIEKNDSMMYRVEISTGEELRQVRSELHPRHDEPAAGRRTPISDLDYILTDLDGRVSRFSSRQ